MNYSPLSKVIVWDIETVPDVKGFAAANGHVGKTDEEVRAELGDKFPKHIYHSNICLGHWLRTGKTAVTGPWMRLEHRTLGSDPRRR